MPSSHYLRPTWAEIRLSSLKNNLIRIQETIGPGTRLMFVVKANAYGHGAVETALYAEREKLVWGFGVSSVEEGLVLREAGVLSPVLVLGSLYPFESFVTAINGDLMVTISSLDAARQVIEAAGALDKKAVCHVKLETGMGRIGARKPSVIQIFSELSASKNAEAAGLYTHLSSVDTSPEFTAAQLVYFKETVAALTANGNVGIIRHAANSAAALSMPESRWDMVRTGLAAYGLMPGFDPVLSWKTRIVFIKTVREGTFISYNRSFKTPRPMKIATLPVGYGDGYIRRFSNNAEVLVNGIKCPVVGNVTMDMTMVDVTGAPDAAVGSEVTLIGRQGSAEIGAEELARRAGTISYEIVTLITSRVPRICV